MATTAAFLGLRPVAKALGMGMLEIPTSGMGSPALSARFSTIPYNLGASSRVTMRTLLARSAMLFEQKYE